MPSSITAGTNPNSRSGRNEETQGSAQSHVATIIGFLLALMPLVVVWDNGGLVAWTRFWLSVAVAVIGLLTLPLIVRHRQVSFLRVLWLPALAALAWFGCLLQTVPLPSDLAGLLSPGTWQAYQTEVPEAVRQSLMAEGAAGADAGWEPTTLSRWKTAHTMYLPGLFGLGVFLGIFLYSQRKAMLQLMVIIAISGGIFSFLAIADSVRGGDKEAATPLITPQNIPHSAPFGSFVNRNSAGLFINLGLACTVGLLITAARMQRRQTSVDDTYELPSEGLFDAVQSGLQRFLKDATGTTVALIVLAILQFAAILASNSRGAFLAGLAGVFCVIAATGRKGKYVWAVPLLLVGTLGVLLFLESLDIKDKASDRIQSIFDAEDGSRVGRLEHWQDSLVTAWHYLPTGSGLGTYSLAYLPYQAHAAQGWAYNADNMYCEWLVEGGLWLPALLIAGVALFVSSLRRLRRVNRAPHLTGLMAMGWYLLAMLIVSQFFDFGILYPANFLTVGLLVGAVLSADARDYAANRQGWKTLKSIDEHETEEDGQPEPPKRWPWVWGLAVCFALIAGLTIHWAYQDAWTDYQIRTLAHAAATSTVAEQRLVKATVKSEGKLLDKPFYEANPELQVAVARALLRRQEELAVGAVRGKLTTAEIKDYRPFIGINYRRSVYYGKGKQTEADAEQALLPGQSLRELKWARDLAKRALVQSPRDVLARYVLLQTSFVENESPEASSLWVQQSQQLWPHSPSVLIPFAELAAVYPSDDLAVEVLAQSLRLQPVAFNRLWPFIELLPINKRQVAVPDHPVALITAVESSLPDNESRQRFAERLRLVCERGEDQLTEAQLSFIRARLECYVNDLPAAIVAFSRGVQLEPSNLAMRFKFVAVLEQVGDLDEAIEQLRSCISQAPKNQSYQAKLRELTELKRDQS